MNDTVLVLGANGRLGRAVVQAFAAAGWQVYAQARRPLLDGGQARVTHLGTAVEDREALVAAAHGATVVVNGLNPLYTRWDTEALPLNDAAIAIARRLDATLMLPGNVYNYGAGMPTELTEQTPERPSTRKGAIRVQMEAAMRARAPRSIIVRAGDYFGGKGPGAWMDQGIIKDLAGKGRITYPGPRHLQHAWAYLPDLARSFVRLAEVRMSLGAHTAFHFPGYALTGDELVAALTRAAHRSGVLPMGRAPAVRSLPWALVRVAGLFQPMLRELARMSYLWRVPHRLAGARLESAIGPIPHTQLDVALEATLRDLGIAPRPGSTGRAAHRADELARPQAR